MCANYNLTVDGPILDHTDAGASDLSITKSDSPDPVTAGANITYTVTATNNWTPLASDVTVDDFLPFEHDLRVRDPEPGNLLGHGVRFVTSARWPGAPTRPS